MDTNTKNALLIWAGTIAGGAGGAFAATKLGVTYGLRLGPWGALAGGVLGAVAGATLSKKAVMELQGPIQQTLQES